MEMVVYNTALIESVAHVTVTLLLEQLVTVVHLRYMAVTRRTALVPQAMSAVLKKINSCVHTLKPRNIFPSHVT
jgi:hypothetical protein